MNQLSGHFATKPSSPGSAYDAKIFRPATQLSEECGVFKKKQKNIDFYMYTNIFPPRFIVMAQRTE